MVSFSGRPLEPVSPIAVQGRADDEPEDHQVPVSFGLIAMPSAYTTASRMRALLRPRSHFASDLRFVLARDAHQREPKVCDPLQESLQVRLVDELSHDRRPPLCALEAHAVEHCGVA